MSERDPIAELVHDLTTHGKPTLAWTIRWSADGREPVKAAWDDVTNEPRAMVDLLRATDLVRYRAATNAWAHEMDDRKERGESLSWYASRGAVLTAVRRAVPVPPTLDECMAASERLRRGDPAPDAAGSAREETGW